VMTILSILLATAEAENPAKTTECMAQFSHKLKWKQLIPIIGK
jgi:hypothetical protein